MRQIFRSVLLEMIADDLSKPGWSWGWVSALDREGRKRASQILRVARRARVGDVRESASRFTKVTN
jgi:hypothetical protein